MATEKFINIQGYYIGESRKNFPHKPAFFFVYAGTFNAEVRSCTLREIVYIGEAEDLWQTSNDSALWNSLIQSLLPGESIFYTIALTDYKEAERQSILKALLYELRPSSNLDCSLNTPEKMTIIVEGNRHAFVPTRIEAPSY